MADRELTGFTRRQLLESMRQALESERSSFISRWRELNDYILPTRGRFTVTDSNKGNRKSDRILDGTATMDARTLSSGMMSGITSPARPWFRLTTPDPDLAEHESVKQWLYVTTERMRWVLARSNFYHKTPSLYKDLGVFATGGLLEVEDDHKVVRFIDLPVGSFAIGLSDTSDPNVFTRVFQMSVRQLVKKFGLESCSAVVKRHYDRGQLEVQIEVVHAVHPNDDFDKSALYAKDALPFRSSYYEKNAPFSRTENKDFLRESGFEEFPGMFPRWEVTGDDIYGTDSPGMTALGDIKQLQQGEKLSLQAIERMVKPPMVGPSELKHVRASILPGDITYVNERDGQKGFRPAYQVNFDVEKLEAKQAQVRGRIDRAFFADLFRMMSMMDQNREGTQPVTAAEIFERHEEKLLALGPVLEQLNVDFLDPTIDRTFRIMVRRGLIPPPPPDIQGSDLKVEYISMMHQAQKSSELGALRSVLEFTIPLAQIDPAVTDGLDTDKLLAHFSESAGAPPDITRSTDKIMQIRGARAAAAKAQQDAQNLAVNAKGIKDLAAADTSAPSALKDLQAASGAGALPVGQGAV